MHHTIRLASDADVAALLDIYAWYVENTAFSFEYEPPGLPEFKDRIQRYMQEAPWLVARMDDQPVGFAYASPHRGRSAYRWNREVSIYFKPDFHGSGLATHLYQTLFNFLRHQGYANALAGIVSPNPRSVAFHEKLGFHRVAVYPNIGYKFNRWYETHWYSLLLQEPTYQPGTILPVKKVLEMEAFSNLSIGKG